MDEGAVRLMLPILEVRDVRKNFGGLWAVGGVSLQVEEGERRAIIGPNGAGKSTLFNLISRDLSCDLGSVYFRGEDVKGLSPHEMALRGMSRTFQITSIFPQLSAIANVQVALFASRGRSLRLLKAARDELLPEARELLASVGLEDVAWQLSGSLSHGDQKRLELAMALAGSPVLLLLDEPTAGMPTRERLEMMALVGHLAMERNVTLLFTEHDMDVVFATAQRISVLHQGRLLMEGTPEEVRSHARVREVYLGWGGRRGS